MTIEIYRRGTAVFSAATLCLFTAAWFGASQNQSELFKDTFILYFVVQLLLYAFAFAIGRRTGIEVGAIFGICAATAIHAMWELQWYKGSNSMPFFFYLFIFVPAIVLGLLVAKVIVWKYLTSRYFSAAALTVLCIAPLPIQFLKLAPKQFFPKVLHGKYACQNIPYQLTAHCSGRPITRRVLGSPVLRTGATEFI